MSKVLCKTTKCLMNIIYGCEYVTNPENTILTKAINHYWSLSRHKICIYQAQYFTSLKEQKDKDERMVNEVVATLGLITEANKLHNNYLSKTIGY